MLNETLNWSSLAYGNITKFIEATDFGHSQNMQTWTDAPQNYRTASCDIILPMAQSRSQSDNMESQEKPGDSLLCVTCCTHSHSNILSLQMTSTLGGAQADDCSSLREVGLAYAVLEVSQKSLVPHIPFKASKDVSQGFCHP